MSGIVRKPQLIFGSSLNTASRLAVWGSLAAGAPQYSGDPTVIQSLAQWATGFDGEVVGNRSPSQEDLNALMYVLSWNIAYLLERGIPEWSALTSYNQYDICRVNRVQYESQSNNNLNNNPVGDSGANWLPALAVQRGPSLALAWACWDGINLDGSGNAILVNSFNVTSVSKSGAGVYQMNFATALPSPNYVMTGSTGDQDGQGFGTADAALVVGNAAGQGNGVRNANACRVCVIDSASKALVQPGLVSAVIFGS